MLQDDIHQHCQQVVHWHAQFCSNVNHEADRRGTGEGPRQQCRHDVRCSGHREEHAAPAVHQSHDAREGRIGCELLQQPRKRVDVSGLRQLDGTHDVGTGWVVL